MVGAKGHKKLIARVKKIDPGAAEYLKNEARTLSTFIESDTLAGAFTWVESPQGHDYWENIAERLVGP